MKITASMKIKNIYGFLIISAVVTALCGLTYLIGQQDLRQAANDPQIQIAEDLSNHLSHKEPIETVVSNQTVDIAQSVNTVIIVFDENGNPLISQALLDGKIPTVPSGVFQYVLTKGEDRFTWQPRNGVRMAAVVSGVNSGKSGFVLVARSLREVELREDNILRLVFFGWTAIIIFLATSFFIAPKLHGSRSMV